MKNILVQAFLSLLVLQVVGAQGDASAPDYFDSLRLSPPGVVAKAPEDGSTVYRVAVTSLDDNSTVAYRLAGLMGFLPFTDVNSGERILPETINDAFAALMAVYHFNNIQKSPILTEEDVAECPDLRLTMELLDTEFSPIETTRAFTSVLQRTPSFRVPFPSAVIGAYRSAVTSPLAILTGVNDIPQVSYASTAVDFDVKAQYPLFGRTVTSSIGEAEAAVQYFKSINSTHVAILFVTDSYGSALQKAFQDAASKQNITTEPIPFSFYIKKDSPEALSVAANLKRLEYRHVYAILFENQFEPIMSAGLELGVVGPEYLYVFPGFDPNNFKGMTISADSPLVEAYKGAGILQMQGGIPTTGFTMGQYEPPPLESPPTTGFERFRESWVSALQDEAFVSYVQSMLPNSLDSIATFDRSAPFASDPGSSFRPFLYDAVTGAALSMCRATNASFTGQEVFQQFAELDFDGTSGRVKIDNETGTRDYTTISFAMWNIQVQGANAEGNAIVDFVPAFSFEQDTWRPIATNEFIYSNGMTIAPDSLPKVDYNPNYIGQAGRIVGYTLMGITMASAIASLLWLIWYRKEHVIASAQPLFLFMVSSGVIVMSSTIVPLGLEEPVVLTPQGLNVACMSSIWCYIMGATITFSALFAKTKGVHLAYLNPELDFIHVSAIDIFLFFAFYFVVNFIILITWTFVSPLTWSRIYDDATDVFDRPTESYAVCQSDQSLPFVITLAVLNLGFLVIGNWWAYRSRNIETEYNESSYIGVSMAATLQAWAMGIPILIVVWDSPPAKFYVSVGIVFVTAQAVLSLVYVPKVIALRKNLQSSHEQKKAEQFASYKEKSGHMTKKDYSKGDSEINGDESESPEDNGDSLGGARRENISTAEMSEVEHNPQEAENNGTDEANEGRPSSGSSTRGSRFGGAISSKDVDENRVGGIRVTYNPRSTENLSLAGGSEVSRKTLDYLKAQAQEEQEETNGEQKEPSAEETGPNELPPVDEGAEEAEDGDGDVEGGVEDGEGAGESKDKEEPKEEAAPAPASTPAE